MIVVDATPKIISLDRNQLRLILSSGEGAGPGGGLSEAQVQDLIDAAIDDLLDGAPGALNTLNELAAALGDDANFAATVTTAINARVRKGTMQFALAPLTMTGPGVVGSFGQTITLPNASLWEGEEITILGTGFAPDTPDTTILPHSGQTVNLVNSSYTLEFKYGSFPNIIRLRSLSVPAEFGGGWTWAAIGTSGPQFIAAELTNFTSTTTFSRSRLLSQSFIKTWPVDERCFRFPGTVGGNSTAYRCAAGWGNIPNGIDLRLDLIARPPTAEQMTGLGMKFMELVTVQDPAMGGGDRMELALMLVSADNIGTLSLQVDFPIAIGDILLFWEHVPVGNLTETTYHADGAVQYHNRILIRVVLDTAEGEVRFYRGVTHEGDETTTQGQHRNWRLVGTLANADAGSIVTMAGWAVDLGLRFKGDIFWMEAYHGPDGTLLDDVRATDAEPGDISFTSTGGRSWTRWGDHAEIVDPPSYPTLPIAQSDVTGLVTALAGKVSTGSPLLLPSPSGQPDGKIARVTSGAWVLGDAPGQMFGRQPLSDAPVGTYQSVPFAAAHTTTSPSTSTANSLGVIAVCPTLVRRRTRFDRIACYLSTAATDAGAVADLGYCGALESAGYIPDYANATSFGVISCMGAAGLRDLTISQWLDPGLYWLLLNFRTDGTFAGTNPVFYAWSGGGAITAQQQIDTNNANTSFRIGKTVNGAITTGNSITYSQQSTMNIIRMGLRVAEYA